MCVVVVGVVVVVVVCKFVLFLFPLIWVLCLVVGFGCVVFLVLF